MYKFKEALAQIIKITPMVHMLWINICDNGNGRRQAAEGAITFIRLNHHPLTLSSAGIGFKRMDHATIYHSRIKPSCMQ